MKGLMRRSAALASITIPLLVVAAFSGVAMAAGLDAPAPGGAVPPPADAGSPDVLSWLSEHMSGPALKIGGGHDGD